MAKASFAEVRAGAEGSLDEGAAQPVVTFASPAGGVFAGTLVVARAEAGLGGQIPAVGTTHIDAQLTDEDLDGVKPGAPSDGT